MIDGLPDIACRFRFPGVNGDGEAAFQKRQKVISKLARFLFFLRTRKIETGQGPVCVPGGRALQELFCEFDMISQFLAFPVSAANKNKSCFYFWDLFTGFTYDSDHRFSRKSASCVIDWGTA